MENRECTYTRWVYRWFYGRGRARCQLSLTLFPPALINLLHCLFVCLFVLIVYLFLTAIRCLVSPFPYLPFLLN